MPHVLHHCIHSSGINVGICVFITFLYLNYIHVHFDYILWGLKALDNLKIVLNNFKKVLNRM